MKRREVIKAGGAAVVLAAYGGAAGDAASEQACYLPGDYVVKETFFQDAQRKLVKLSDALKPASKAVIVTILGGAYLEAPDRHGGIWCEDTLYEFGNLRALLNAGADKGVQFIGVACPPVYSDKYGWARGVFIDEPEDAPAYLKAAGQFIERTEALKRDGTIPFGDLYYDLRFRLLWNAKEHPAVPAYGKVHSWQGKFKWHKDSQRYGTPCIWFLDPSGKVLREPLYGNNYSSTPPRILYTYWELESALQESLASAAR